MLSNVKLLISYDGTNYKGWQKNLRDPTIEEILQNTLESILQHPVQLQAASRTDAGVHALGQTVNFFTSLEKTDLQVLISQINLLLPKDITVLNCEIAPHDFHPTLSAKGKEYHYYVCLNEFQLPHHRLYSWHIYSHLDISTMRQAAAQFVGEHDFSAFCNMHCSINTQDFVREVSYLAIEEIEGQRLRFVVQGRSFLYKMVRNMVGTLIDIGKKKISLEALPKIIASRDRRQAGISAPAHGLFLKRVVY